MIVENGKYYLYRHIRLDKNEVFYIGKGTKCKTGNPYKRAYTKNSRNPYWLNIINVTSYKIEILKNFQNEEECLKEETKLIEKYGFSWNNTGTLCNIVKDNEEIRYLARISSKNKISKKVYQYDLEGNFIKEWNSVTEAVKICKCDVYNAFKTSSKNRSAGGYLWTDYKSLKINKIKNKNKTKKIYQFALNGKLIKIWDSANQASKELNINYSSIRNCLIGLSKTAFGFIWDYDNEINISNIANYEIYENNNLIYSSILLKDCANFLNCKAETLSVYIRRGKPFKEFTIINKI